MYPLFVTEFQLQPSRVEFTPDMFEFLDGIVGVINEFQQTSMQNQNLVSDSYFDAFTRSADGTSAPSLEVAATALLLIYSFYSYGLLLKLPSGTAFPQLHFHIYLKKGITSFCDLER